MDHGSWFMAVSLILWCSCLMTIAFAYLLIFLFAYLPIANCLLPISYSVLKLLTGFETAAFTAWKLMVAKAINMVTRVVITNTGQVIVVL